MNLPLALAVVSLGVVGVSAVSAQRNDPTKNTSKKEKSEKESLTYEDAIQRYGPPDQEKQMKSGSLVCTWVQTEGVWTASNGKVFGGTTSKMVIFFDQNGMMKDRKFINGALFSPESQFRLDR
jgi:hypothetical protein